jgi:hypothetical protein
VFAQELESEREGEEKVRGERERRLRREGLTVKCPHDVPAPPSHRSETAILCLSVCLSLLPRKLIHLSVCLSICLSLPPPSVCLSACLSACPTPPSSAESAISVRRVFRKAGAGPGPAREPVKARTRDRVRRGEGLTLALPGSAPSVCVLVCACEVG